jgi:hypothetical protein
MSHILEITNLRYDEETKTATVHLTNLFVNEDNVREIKTEQDQTFSSEGIPTPEEVIAFGSSLVEPGEDIGVEFIPDQVDEPKEEVSAKEEVVPEVIPTQPEVKTYLGKKIISESTSTINEKEYITLRLEDGSVCQLSEAEYKELVK